MCRSWKILSLCLIDDRGVVRYGELRKEIFGITNTMLATSLKEMGRSEPLTLSSGDQPNIFSLNSIYVPSSVSEI